MRLKVLLGVTVSLGALLAVPASGSSLQRHVTTCLRSAPPATDCGSGRLEVEFSGKLAPRKLPGRRFVPVGMTVGGSIGTEGRGHPSALREATVAVDRGVRVDTEGLAGCARRRLERLDAAAARRVCRRAIVGHGVARVGLASSERLFSVPLTLYNGGASGGVLEGDGSLLGFRLEIKRGFAASGRRRSYLSARCPNGALRVNVPNLVFLNEAHTPGVAPQTVLKGGLAMPCGTRR